MSQEALAAAVTERLAERGEAVKQSAVSFWETGRSAPTPTKVQALEDVLGVRRGELAGVLWPPLERASDEQLLGLDAYLDDLVRQVADLSRTVARLSEAVRDSRLGEGGPPDRS